VTFVGFACLNVGFDMRILRRRTKVLLGLAMIPCGYVLSYMVNTHLGGYDPFFTSDGRRSYSNSMLAHDCIMWQPRFGSYYSQYRRDALGLIFYPLLRLDHGYVHRTHSVWDADFDAWSVSLAARDVHPNHREAYRRAKEERRTLPRHSLQ